MGLFDKFKKKGKKSKKDDTQNPQDVQSIQNPTEKSPEIKAETNQTTVSVVSPENNPFVEQVVATPEEVKKEEQPVATFDSIFNAQPSDLIMPINETTEVVSVAPNVAATAAIIDNPNTVNSSITVDAASVIGTDEQKSDEITEIVSEAVAQKDRELDGISNTTTDESLKPIEDNATPSSNINSEIPNTTPAEISNEATNVPVEPNTVEPNAIEQPIPSPSIMPTAEPNEIPVTGNVNNVAEVASSSNIQSVTEPAQTLATENDNSTAETTSIPNVLPSEEPNQTPVTEDVNNIVEVVASPNVLPTEPSQIPTTENVNNSQSSTIENANNSQPSAIENVNNTIEATSSPTIESTEISSQELAPENVSENVSESVNIIEQQAPSSGIQPTEEANQIPEIKNDNLTEESTLNNTSSEIEEVVITEPVIENDQTELSSSESTQETPVQDINQSSSVEVPSNNENKNDETASVVPAEEIIPIIEENQIEQESQSQTENNLNNEENINTSPEEATVAQNVEEQENSKIITENPSTSQELETPIVPSTQEVASNTESTSNLPGEIIEDIKVGEDFIPQEVIESQQETIKENALQEEQLPEEIEEPIIELTTEQIIENPEEQLTDGIENPSNVQSTEPLNSEEKIEVPNEMSSETLEEMAESLPEKLEDYSSSEDNLPPKENSPIEEAKLTEEITLKDTAETLDEATQSIHEELEDETSQDYVEPPLPESLSDDNGNKNVTITSADIPEPLPENIEVEEPIIVPAASPLELASTDEVEEADKQVANTENKNDSDTLDSSTDSLSPSSNNDSQEEPLETETSPDEKPLLDRVDEMIRNLSFEDTDETEPSKEVPKGNYEEKTRPIIEDSETIILPILNEAKIEELERKKQEQVHNTQENIIPIIEEESDELNLGITPTIENFAEDLPVLEVAEAVPPIDTTEEETNIYLDNESDSSKNAKIIKQDKKVDDSIKEEIGVYISEPTTTKFCNNCGIMLTDDSSICPSCGEPID